MPFNDQRFAEVMRQRYGVTVDGDERDVLRLVFAEPVRHDRPPMRGSVVIAMLLMAGSMGAGFWIAVGLFWSMGWLK